MRGFLLTFVTASLLAVGSAQAAEHEDYAAEQEDYVGRPGFFVGLSGAIGGVPDKQVDKTTGVTGGLEARAGYSFGSLFGYDGALVAAEVQFDWLDNVLERPGRSDVDIWTLTLNAKVYAPAWQNGQVYVLVGPGVTQTDVESSNSQDDIEYATRVGAGVDMWLTRNVVATFELRYVLPVRGLTDLDYLSGGLGLQYRF